MAENGTTIAKAYVQIMPSAQGIKANLTKAMGGDVAAAGTSAGQSFGSKMASAIKGVLATAAIGKALTATIAEGADLEQSLGGVKTLFGDAADTVIANAQKAYKTTQLSANDYMENITGFSARLLQSMGGDTEAAAALADTAMRDMADNANKMGTDMGFIQETYQSLARGNYEMLDNLKLGYGGTQAEMARLINDSGVLGDTMEATANNVNSIGFDKFIEAIHVIQERMGLAGTATEEAETTITGSLNAMKASFANVLGNLTLGQDIGPSLNALAQTVTTFLTANMLPAVWNILSALPGALVTFVSTLGPQLAAGLATFVPQVVADITAAAPQMLTAAQALVTGFATAVTTQLPTLLQNGVQLVQQLVNGAVQALPGITSVATQLLGQFASSFATGYAQLLSAGAQIIGQVVSGVVQSIPSLITIAGTVITQFLSALIAAAPQVWQSGVQMILQVVQGIVSSLPQIISSAAGVIAQFLAGIGQQLPQLLQSGITMIAQLVAGLIQAIPQVIAAIPQIISGIVGAFLSYDWLSIGSNIIQGIANGIASGVGVIIDAAKSAASAALNAAKEFLGIASPSKVMRDQVGRFIPEGMALGITRNLRPLRSAMQQATDMVAARLPGPSLAFDAAARWQPAFAGPGGAVGGSPQQTFIFNQPVQTPDEFARAVRVQQTYGLAGGR